MVKFNIYEMLIYESLKFFYLLLGFKKKRKGEEVNFYCIYDMCFVRFYRGIIWLIFLNR